MQCKKFACLLAAMQVLVAAAQHGPLNGSGKIVVNNFSYSNFDKLELIDLAGRVEVEVGKPFLVSIAIDDNLSDLLEATVSQQALHISLKGNRSNRLYIENTNIVVKIGMPSVTFIKQNGNNSLQVNGLNETYFRLKNRENGSTRLNGAVEEMEITGGGNGNVYAENVSVKKIAVYKSGNGNIYINTPYSFTANGSGNGDVINKGTGRADNNSRISGNGKIKYPHIPIMPDSQAVIPKSKKVALTITNLTGDWVNVYVKYPVQGSYGIGLKPKETITELLPEGAKLYQDNRFTLFKKPLYTVSRETEAQSLSIR